MIFKYLKKCWKKNFKKQKKSFDIICLNKRFVLNLHRQMSKRITSTGHLTCCKPETQNKFYAP